VIVVLDASTLINLANGEVLDAVLQLQGFDYHVSSVVRRESKTVAEAIDQAVAEGRLTLVDDAMVPLAEFVEAQERFNLDDGETECLIAAQTLGGIVACDDAAGRNAVRETLGVARRKGSIGLLKLAIEQELLTAQQAADAYKLMRERGGYLPDLLPDYFG
jgi:predicted nucleic acid-binding protein